MNRWSALAVLLAFAGALAFRLPQLDIRPLHNDEAVNAFTASALWQEGTYAYNPDEYHGPTLHYATVPFLALSGARDANEISDGTLRLSAAAFGAALVLLLWLFRDGLGAQATTWAALFLAISPAMVFYSRYFIHEMLLVFFTALALGASWRYTQKRSAAWAVTAGASVGLMFATKETFVISVAAVGAALGATCGRNLFSLRRMSELLRVRDLCLGLAAFLLIWGLFFSSFLTHPVGLLDSIRTYFPWLKRAAGESVHLHPWYFYLHRLAWFHPSKGPIFTEGLVLILAVLGAVAAFKQKGPSLSRFLVFYTLFLTVAYSLISYKTPWCLLNFYFGMILLAGVGAAAVIGALRAKALKSAAVAIFLLFSIQLSFQSWRASFAFSADRRNPYVYAQTSPDLRNLVRRAHDIAQGSAAKFDTVVKVMVPENDYWPLPWCLRDFRNVGWYEKVPADPYAPLIIVSSILDAKLDEKSDRKWIMTGITELRPGRFLELYVELEAWKKYVETLPPDPE